MCKPTIPKATGMAPVAPMEAPKALALPDSGPVMTASSLRLSSRNPLASRPKAGSGLSIS